jgi:hypothetical protein
MKSQNRPLSRRKRSRSTRRAVAANAAGRKLMAVLREIILAERAGGAGLTVRRPKTDDADSTIDLPNARR